MSALEESTRRMHVYEEAVYRATNSTTCSVVWLVTCGIPSTSILCVLFFATSRVAGALLERWSDDSM